MTDKAELLALAELDERLSSIGGCSDGYCIIKRPVGMHTNGGCRCWSSVMTMQRYAHAMNQFVASIRALASESSQ